METRQTTKTGFLSDFSRKFDKYPFCVAGMVLSALAYIRQRKHRKPNPGKCDICGFVCKNDVWLLRHKKKNHTVNVEEEKTIDNLNLEWYCAECKIQYSDKTSFKSHMMTLKHMTREQWRFECETCHSRFPTMTRLTEHVNIQHLKKFKHKCDQCDKQYVKRHELNKHIAVIHDKKKPGKRYFCHVCGAGFTVSKSLKEHLFKHSGARPFACPLCPATFTFSAALYTHNRLKHLKIKPKWYQNNLKRGNKKGKKDAKGNDRDTKSIDEETAGTEKGDVEETEMGDIEWLEEDSEGAD